MSKCSGGGSGLWSAPGGRTGGVTEIGEADDDLAGILSELERK